MRNNALYLIPSSDYNPETLINCNALAMIQSPGTKTSTLHLLNGSVVTCERIHGDRIRAQWESLGHADVPETAAHGSAR